MKSLVVGQGSIGQRHVRILDELGCDTAVVSSQKGLHSNCYSHIEDAIYDFKPVYVVIANRTSEHYQTLVTLAKRNYNGIVLCEKPLFNRLQKIPHHSFQRLFVAYNLRFHPLIKKLRQMLDEESIVSVHAYVGQYLPHWRPDTDYRKSYSAHKDQGGGVLRDLSHELDYLRWIFGGYESIIAVGGKYSELEIDSDDVYSLIVTTNRCPIVTIHMNYLDRVSRRELIINTNKHTITANLVAGYLSIDGKSKKYCVDKDFTYREMHHAIMMNDFAAFCSQEDGVEILKVIASAEQSSKGKEWVIL